jgi:NADH-quinone oxidoreductase subunit G
VADVRKLAGQSGASEKTPFRSPIEDFYFTNAIARASAVMAECSTLAEGRTLSAAE